MSKYHLAQINIARMLTPTDDPVMADFVAQRATVNALADESLGFTSRCPYLDWILEQSWRVVVQKGVRRRGRETELLKIFLTLRFLRDKLSLSKSNSSLKGGTKNEIYLVVYQLFVERAS